MLKIYNANLIPNPVNASEDLQIQVDFITWDFLKYVYTWDSLKNSGETWESIRNKAIDLQFSMPSWDALKQFYRTWNSIERYGVNSWNELEGK